MRRILIYSFLYLFSIILWAKVEPEIIDQNRKLLNLHFARLQKEISDLRDQAPKSTAKDRNQFDPAIQIKRILEIKEKSLDNVQKGLKNIDKISAYGILTDLNQVDLALSGVNPFDKEAAENASRALGHTYSKAMGNVGRNRVSMVNGSFHKNKSDPDCVKNLKSKNKFKPETIQMVCKKADSANTETECYECLLQMFRAGGASSLQMLLEFSKDMEVKEAIKLEMERQEKSKEVKAEKKRKDLLESPFEKMLKTPNFAVFLKELGITKAISRTSDKNDLSNQFYTPLFQGQTGACAAYAIVSDIEVTGKTPKLSEGSLYGQLARFNRDFDSTKTDKYFLETYAPESPEEVRKRFRMEGAYQHTFEKFKKQAVIPESKKGFEAEFLNDYKASTFKIEKTVSVDNTTKNPINFEMIRTMIDSNKPPVAWISSDKRSSSENWIEIEPGGGSSHVLNIVGYGYSGVDPKDGKSKPYLILRDSLSKNGTHVQVNAENFLSHLERLEKTIVVKKEK